MRKLLLILTVGVLFQTAHAQNRDKKWGLGLGAGAYYGNTLEGTGLATEFYLSRWLSPSFDLMLLNNLGIANSEISSTLDYSASFLNLRYKFNNGYIFKENSSVQPYLYGGPGIIMDNKTEGLNWDAGLGFKFPLSPSVSLFAEAGFIEGLRGEKARDEGTFTESFWKGVGGIEISFGKSKDADGDGVPDRKDDCPNTPQGVAVDKNGCPIDTDGDGVPDYKDDCPTEVGEIALNGCPDRDGDGVADKDDLCPDVAGVKELAGCPDSDGDGVADKDDKCPDTPRGYKVDRNGCPYDRDGDGVVDEEDDCPTEAGPADNNGCPVVATNPEAIHYEFDKSSLTSSAKAGLDEVIKTMKDHSEYSVELYGHADEIGTEAYNMKLSERRANAARTYLVEKGIAASRIVKVVPLGKSQPVASNNTEEGRAKNRRVEFKLVK
ncbi:OmpA family protein [uncultured Sunxiuqinia sp.]|uniref:OmpA family protein n=1 Tax=uncultured Sunxiuqinia sp. TaxID=1573825 RepID=UPI00261EB02F|nr:OmpA family protein [uncultured Sunxiuqinia sp.]